MKRRASHLLVVASASPCFALILLAAVSYLHPFEFHLSLHAGIYFRDGAFSVERYKYEKIYSRTWNPWAKPQCKWMLPYVVGYYHGPETLISTVGPQFNGPMMDKPWPELWLFVISIWLPAVLTAILPLMKVSTVYRARRRNRAGRCEICGYDLRATIDRCPECGNVPSALKLEVK